MTDPIWICAYYATVIPAVTPETHPGTDCPYADYASHRRNPQLDIGCGFYLVISWLPT